MAAVLLQNARQTEILTRQGVDQREPGIPVSVDVDTTEIKNNEVVMLVLDYAGNASAYQINLGGAGDEEPVSDTAIYANNTLDRAWIAFDPGKMSTAKTICDGYIYAAEYIDGYVFTVDTDKRFCVAPLGNLENQTYIETLNLPSNALDMAYNYADGKLYILWQRKPAVHRGSADGSAVHCRHGTAEDRYLADDPGLAPQKAPSMAQPTAIMIPACTPSPSRQRASI